MAPVARRNHPNLRVALNQRHSKHGVGNEGIVLCRDDERGDGDGIEHVACACAIVVVGSTGVPSVRGRISVVEFAHQEMSIEIP